LVRRKVTPAEPATKEEVVREAGRESLGAEVARMTEAEMESKRYAGTREAGMKSLEV
jgi:hypothetical protein